jgi:hypothetical protein
MKEKYEIWEQTSEWPKSLYLQALHDDYEGFRLILEDKDGQGSVFKVSFDSHLAYRNIDEGDRLSSLPSLTHKGEKLATVYLVKNSNWVHWFKEENAGKYDNEGLLHWAIITPNDWVDVISLEPPVFTR